MRRQATQIKENAKKQKAQDAKLETLKKQATTAASKTATDASEIKRKSTDSGKGPPRKLQS